MNLQKIYSVLAPMGTPLAPAVVMMAGMYHGLTLSTVPPAIAIVVAIISGLGLEATGALASAMTVKALKKRDWQAMFFAAVGIAGYVIFAAIGILNVPNSQIFVSMIMVSLIAYLVYGVYSYFMDQDEKTVKENKSEVEKTQVQIALIEAQTQAQIALIEAQRRLSNSQARLAKASSGQGQVSSVSSGQSGQKAKQYNQVLLMRVSQYMQDNPGCSARDIARALGISPTTASEYKQEVEAQNGIR